MEVNKIYNENCLETMKGMDSLFVDLIVTSPPYDKLRKYNGYSFEFEKIAQELFRIIKDGGVLVWVVGDQTVNGSETGTSFRQALHFIWLGFKLYDTMIYRKENFPPKSHRRYEQAFEYMFVLSKGVPKTFNPIKVECKGKGKGKGINWGRKGSSIAEGVFRRRNEVIVVKEDKIKENVWTYTCGSSQTGHPAPFPYDLAADHILSWSNDGDLIYDPFMGSGTTAKACINLNRNYIGSEISKEYYENAEIRIKDHLGLFI